MIATTTFAAAGAVDKALERFRFSQGAEQHDGLPGRTARHGGIRAVPDGREAISYERAGYSCWVWPPCLTSDPPGAAPGAVMLAPSRFMARRPAECGAWDPISAGHTGARDLRPAPPQNHLARRAGAYSEDRVLACCFRKGLFHNEGQKQSV